MRGLRARGLWRVIAMMAVFAAVVGLVGLAQQDRARACSCAPPPPLVTQIEDAVVAADAEPGRVFFVGEQVTDGEQPHTFRIDVVLGGEVDGDTIDVNVPIYDTSCGSSSGSLFGRGVRAYEAVPGTGGRSIMLSACGGSPFEASDALAVTGRSLPPTGAGPPSFVVGHRSATSNVAVLDRAGQVLATNDERSDARVLELAACPDARAVVAAVAPRDHNASVRLEVWAIPDLSLLRTIETEASMRFGHGWQTRAVDAIECHDPTGQTVSWLEPAWTGQGGPPQRAGAAMVIAEMGRVLRSDVGDVRALTIDHGSDRAWAVGGEAGDELLVLDLSGGVVDTEPLPGGFTGRTIQRDADGELLILADAAYDPLNDHLASVDTVISGQPGALTASPTSVSGWLQGATSNDADAIALIRVPRTGTYATLFSPGGSAQAIRLTGDEHEPMAVGRCGLLDGGFSRPAYLDYVSHARQGVRAVEGVSSVWVSLSLERVDRAVFDSLARPVVRTIDRQTTTTVANIEDRALSQTTSDITDGGGASAPLSSIAIPGCDSVTATLGGGRSWGARVAVGASGAAIVALAALARRRRP